jgi:2-methylcitrate dehydratase PrpD
MNTVSEQLTEFLRRYRDSGLPPEPVHEAKRLLLNQIKASVGAADQPLIRILSEYAGGAPAAGDTAHVLWLGSEATAEHAAMINGALFEVLDFHDTYIPTYLHAVSGILPAALAAAEVRGSPGVKLLGALALGIEVELACAEILMPTGYFRGFIPLGLVGGVGAAAACSVLADLDDDATCTAISMAMSTAGGTYATVGSMGLPYITGLTARNGLMISELAGRGITAPVTAFEGDKGMLESYSDESPDKIDGVLGQLGVQWRIHGQSFKTMPTETITHGPLECALALLGRSKGRQLQRMVFGVSPIVVKIADERFERFGIPSTELEARFDLRFCVAAAWHRGRFTLDEMREPAYTDSDILSLREKIQLVADEAQETFDGAWGEASYTDGTSDRIDIPAFAGTVARPLTDGELVSVFRTAAEGFISRERADEIADAVWALDTAPDAARLMSLLVR